jgi:hypothetical protein
MIGLLDELPDVVRFSDAVGRISERQFRRLVAAGHLVPLARGLYRKSGWEGDEDLAEIAVKSPAATVCLRAALARYDLVDDIPAFLDVAVPRGSWTPATTVALRWHHFDPATFTVGRVALPVGAGLTGWIYSAERSIVDAFRMRHLEGADMANDALKRWLRQGGQPSELLNIARAFPRALPALRQSLEVLL